MLNSNIYNVLVTGSSGQVGNEIKAISSDYSYNFFFTDRNNIDITSKDSIKEFCKTNNINVIINCAAYTAVDKAQSDEINADLRRFLSDEESTCTGRRRHPGLLSGGRHQGTAGTWQR